MSDMPEGNETLKRMMEEMFFGKGCFQREWLSLYDFARSAQQQGRMQEFAFVLAYIALCKIQ